MKILKPNFVILNDDTGMSILKHIELAGRQCYQSADVITDDSYIKFINGIIKNGHESVLEHSSISVLFNVDRGITHELVRHRLASFSQESTRYCNYSKDRFGDEISVINFEGSIQYDNTMKDLSIHLKNEIINTWSTAMSNAETSYMRLLKLGASPQMARGVLPNALKSSITITANLREWRLIFKLRTAKPAHPQMREIMIPLLDLFKEYIPIVFDDINY